MTKPAPLAIKALKVSPLARLEMALAGARQSYQKQALRCLDLDGTDDSERARELLGVLAERVAVLTHARDVLARYPRLKPLKRYAP